MKRLSDFLISLALIIVLLPFMIIIGIIIKIDSPGPIFYCRKKNGRPAHRLGKKTKPFYYFKFRSMFVGTEKVTKFGFFIRRWHIDELPELFLVLIGSMSLVGPRPLPRGRINRNLQSYYASLESKPGITGPFQINQCNKNTVEEIIRMNNWYSKNQGFLTDLIIILKTPLVIIKRKGGGKGNFQNTIKVTQKR